MNFLIGQTEYQNKTFHMHSHDYWEIIVYHLGQGTLFFGENSMHVKSGNIVIVPPKTLHCSNTQDQLKSFYLAGKMDSTFNFTSPFIFNDDSQEGVELCRIIFNNRFKKSEFLNSLCTAFLQFILQNLKIEDDKGVAVNKIIDEINFNFADATLDLNYLLKKSGYAEDYIRSHFKKVTGKTPVEYLTEIRITHAKQLINLYKNAMPLGEVALLSGFNDYVYFSRRFKSFTGVSPQDYKRDL